MSRRILVLLPLLAGVIACGGSSQGGPGGPGGPGAMPPAAVQAVTLRPHPVPRTSEFVATIQSLASTTIQPQVEGIVTRIFVKSGDRVRPGQVLVQIDPDKQRASVGSLEASRAAREADVAYAKQQLDRIFGGDCPFRGDIVLVRHHFGMFHAHNPLVAVAIRLDDTCHTTDLADDGFTLWHAAGFEEFFHARETSCDVSARCRHTASVEGAQRQLCTRLTNGLSSNDTNC